MKKLINVSGEIIELTFEGIMERYKGLIVNRCNKYKAYYEFEDLFQMASLGLWKAYSKHEVDNGDFTNLAYSYVQSHINWCRQTYRDRSKNKTSYIKEINNLESKDGWKGSIADEINEYENLENRILIDQAKDYIKNRLDREKIHARKATIRNLEFLDLISKGYTQNEIAIRYNLNLSTVQRGLYKEYEKIRNFYKYVN